jgi:hypothetical protein
LKQLLNGDAENLLILSSEILFGEGEALNINQIECQQRIEAMLDSLVAKGMPPGLIILDNLSSLGGGIDENDNSELDKQLQWLIRLRHKGFAVIVVHHAGKSGDQRGASRREDILDTSIQLAAPDEDEFATSDDAGATFDLIFTKTRGRAPTTTKIRLSLRPNEKGKLEWQFHNAVSMKPHHRTLKRIALGVPRPDGGVRAYETQAELSENYFAKGTVSKHITRLAAELLVVAESRRLCITRRGAAMVQKIFGTKMPPNADYLIDDLDESELP